MVRIRMGDRIGIDNAFLLYSSCEQEEEKKEKKSEAEQEKQLSILLITLISST